MTAKLNEQVEVEFYSSNFYLQMSSWCAFNSLEHCANFLRKHSQEEMGHMFRLFDYINETGALAVIPSIDKPPTEFDNLRELFEAIYAHEQFVTKKINELAEVAFTEKDFSTFSFLQWYVAEQHEEERLFKGILDRIDIIGLEGRGLYHIDMEIGNIDAGEKQISNPFLDDKA